MPEKTKTTRKDTKQILKYFYQKALPYKWKVLICISCTIIITIVNLYIPILTAHLTDTISKYGILENSEIYENLIKFVVQMGILWCIPIIFPNILHYFSTKVTLQGTTDIQDENIQFLTHSSYRFLTDQQT